MATGQEQYAGLPPPASASPSMAAAAGMEYLQVDSAQVLATGSSGKGNNDTCLAAGGRHAGRCSSNMLNPLITLQLCSYSMNCLDVDISSNCTISIMAVKTKPCTPAHEIHLFCPAHGVENSVPFVLPHME